MGEDARRSIIKQRRRPETRNCFRPRLRFHQLVENLSQARRATTPIAPLF